MMQERIILVVAGAAPPFITLVGLQFARPDFPVVTAIGITVVWYAALLAVLSETRISGSAPEQDLRLDLVEEVGDYPSIAITAVAGFGVCPLGFRTGQRWTINDVGRLSHPICLPARTAIQAAVTRAGMTGLSQGIEAACQCPLLSRSVVFNLTGEDGRVNLQPFREREVPAT